MAGETMELHEVGSEDRRLNILSEGLGTKLSRGIRNTEQVEAVGRTGGEEGPDDGEARKFRIGIVKVTDLVLTYRIGSAPAVKVSLGDIVIEDFSNESGGAAELSAVLGRILRAIASSAVESGVDLPGVLGDSLEGSLRGGKAVVDEAVKFTGEVIKLTGEALKSGEEAGKGVVGARHLQDLRPLHQRRQALAGRARLPALSLQPGHGLKLLRRPPPWRILNRAAPRPCAR